MTEFYDVNFLAPPILNAPNKIFGPKLAHSSSFIIIQLVDDLIVTKDVSECYYYPILDYPECETEQMTAEYSISIIFQSHCLEI